MSSSQLVEEAIGIGLQHIRSQGLTSEGSQFYELTLSGGWYWVLMVEGLGKGSFAGVLAIDKKSGVVIEFPDDSAGWMPRSGIRRAKIEAELEFLVSLRAKDQSESSGGRQWTMNALGAIVAAFPEDAELRVEMIRVLLADGLQGEALRQAVMVAQQMPEALAPDYLDERARSLLRAAFNLDVPSTRQPGASAIG